MKLTPRQEAFCREYVVDFNKGQAAIRAGYSSVGASTQALRLLQKTEVQRRIAAFRERVTNRLEVSAERVLQEYARLAFVDPRKAFDENGNLRPIHLLDDDTAAAISGMEVEFKPGTDGYRVAKIKLAPKVPALEGLAKHLGLFADKRDADDVKRGAMALVEVFQLLREFGQGKHGGAVVDTTATRISDR